MAPTNNGAEICSHTGSVSGIRICNRISPNYSGIGRGFFSLSKRV
jgi:hypothetical protein